MEAIILAGGLGTRLKSVISDEPKPMVVIGKKPFLYYILNQLHYYGINHVILSIGYKASVIENYFQENFRDIKISYSVENEPLGTGGALKAALKFVSTTDVLVLNGDTFFNIDLNLFLKSHLERKRVVSVALKKMINFDRYGAIDLSNENLISSFHEKEYRQEGYINAGIYAINKSFIVELGLPNIFSLEKDFLECYYKRLAFYGHLANGYFIDIGVPDDYEQAQRDYKLGCFYR